MILREFSSIDLLCVSSIIMIVIVIIITTNNNSNNNIHNNTKIVISDTLRTKQQLRQSLFGKESILHVLVIAMLLKTT